MSAATIALTEIAAFPLVYLATPYTKFNPDIDAAFRDASALAAKLLEHDVKVYSPIAHCHPIAIYGGLNPRDHAIWIPFNEAMMTASAALLVAQMEGWRESFGVLHEIKFFAEQRKPVFYLDTVTLRVADAAWEFA
jgi:hypothetical protein